jgi:hypothetical protein
MKSLAYCPNRRDSAKPAGAFHDSANLNLAKRRLCVALGIRLGSSEHCCAISVARVRAALTASIPRSNRPLARRTNFGAAKSCSLVIIFMIRPPTAQSGESNYAHRSRPYHGSRNSGDSERPTGAFNERDNCFPTRKGPGVRDKTAPLRRRSKPARNLDGKIPKKSGKSGAFALLNSGT